MDAVIVDVDGTLLDSAPDMVAIPDLVGLAVKPIRHFDCVGSEVAAAHAVKTHSFSADFEPLALEARILQDSDRLDAIGMVGVARCFYVAGRMGSALYDFTNPMAEGREYQDKQFTLEHFHTKLLKLALGFQTVEGARLAQIRQRRLELFLAEFMDEIGVE